MDWLRDHLWETWLALAIMLGIAELLSLDLVLAMLAVGALAGMSADLLGAPFGVQAIVAAATATLTLLVVRPALAQRLQHGPELVLGPTKLIGHRAVVTEQILGVGGGRVLLDGETWSAVGPDADVVIAPGAEVEVVAINGATAEVRPVVAGEASEDGPEEGDI